jgi:hypothetical protein
MTEQCMEPASVQAMTEMIQISRSSAALRGIMQTSRGIVGLANPDLALELAIIAALQLGIRIGVARSSRPA